MSLWASLYIIQQNLLSTYYVARINENHNLNCGFKSMTLSS